MTDASCSVALVVAELAANAVCHGRLRGRNFHVRVDYEGPASRFRIEVSTLCSAGRPSTRRCHRRTRSRGVASSWWSAWRRSGGGAPRNPIGKIVWAEVAVGRLPAGTGRLGDDQELPAGGTGPAGGVGHLPCDVGDEPSVRRHAHGVRAGPLVQKPCLAETGLQLVLQLRADFRPVSRSRVVSLGGGEQDPYDPHSGAHGALEHTRRLRQHAHGVRVDQATVAEPGVVRPHGGQIALGDLRAAGVSVRSRMDLPHEVAVDDGVGDALAAQQRRNLPPHRCLPDPGSSADE